MESRNRGKKATSKAKTFGKDGIDHAW